MYYTADADVCDQGYLAMSTVHERMKALGSSHTLNTERNEIFAAINNNLNPGTLKR